MIYVLFYISNLFLVICEVFTKDSWWKKYLYVYSIIFLVILSGFRLEVGTDWWSYVEIYNNPARYPTVELGYAYFNWTFSEHLIDYNFFLLLISCICLIPLMLFLHIEVNLKFLAILVFFSDVFFYYNMSGMRQGIAISIILISAVFLVRKKNILFYLSVIIASLFHHTAIIFLIARCIHFINLKAKILLLMLSLSLLLSLSLNSLIDFIVGYDLGRTVNYYLSDGYNNPSYLAFFIGLLKRSWVIILTVILYYKLDQFLPNKYKDYLKLYLLGYCFFISFYMILPDIAVRISAYFLVFDMFLIASFFEHIKKKLDSLLLLFITAGLIFYKVLSYFLLPGFIYKTFLF